MAAVDLSQTLSDLDKSLASIEAVANVPKLRDDRAGLAEEGP